MVTESLQIAYLDAGRTDEAIATQKEKIKLLVSKYGPDNRKTMSSRWLLASMTLNAGRTREAIAMYDEILSSFTAQLGPNQGTTNVSRKSLADALLQDGQTSRGIALLEEALNRGAGLLCRNDLSKAYLYAGRTGDAIALGQETLNLCRIKNGHRENLESTDCRCRLSEAYLAAGRPSDAISLLEGAIGQGLYPSGEHVMQASLANAYSAAGEYGKAEALLRDWLRRGPGIFGVKDGRTADVLAMLGRNLILLHRFGEAESALRESLAIRMVKFPYIWSRFNIESMLGASLLGQRKYAEAEPLLLSGYEGMKVREAAIPAPDRQRLTEAGERLVSLYESWGQPEKAEAWRQKLRLGSRNLPEDVFARP